MDEIISKSLAKGISYTDYTNLVSNLVAEGKSTGLNQSDDLLNYSKLNDRRMKRLLKTLKIDVSSEEFIANVSQEQQWILITESWCGDAAQSTPMIHKVAEASDKIDLTVVLRDENSELMNEFLTNGNQAIPKLIVLNKHTNEVIDSWGPRPSTATKMVAEYKDANGALDAQFKEDLQKWYNKDKGINTLEDLKKMLQNIEAKKLKKAS